MAVEDATVDTQTGVNDLNQSPSLFQWRVGWRDTMTISRSQAHSSGDGRVRTA